jgi:hypothetical protein
MICKYRLALIGLPFHTMNMSLRHRCLKFFFMVLEFELRALHLLGRYSITWVTSLALFALVIFQIGSYFILGGGLDCDPPIYASQVSGMTGTHHHTWLFIGWRGVLWTFCLGWPGTMILLISTSQVDFQAWGTTPSKVLNFDVLQYIYVFVFAHTFGVMSNIS